MNAICRITILSLTRVLCAGPMVCKVWSISPHEFTDGDSLEEKSFDDFETFLTDTNINERQTFSCNLCGNEYAWISSLRRHQLQCGNKEAVYNCNYCVKKFYRRDKFKDHLFVYHKLNSKRNACMKMLRKRRSSKTLHVKK